MAVNRNQAIESWLLTTVNAPEMVDRYDDLHISTIDPGWRDRDQWIDGAIESLVRACAIRRKNDLPLVISVSFSIAADATISIGAREDLRQALLWSPPSLVVFRPGQAPWQPAFRSGLSDPSRSAFEVKEVNLGDFGLPSEVEASFMTDYLPADTLERVRTLFLSSDR